MRVTVVGGGNIGTQVAVHCAKKHQVTIYGSRPEKIARTLYIVNERKEVIHEGIIEKATQIPEEAFKNCDIIFITMPSFMMEELAKLILPFCYPGLRICIVPGNGGAECAFKQCIAMGAVIIGLERVPSVARLVEYGKSVCATGYRDELKISALPKKNISDSAKLIGEIFEMKCTGIDEYLSITMTPSNPILHTTRLYRLFKDYDDEKVYRQLPLFYEEWDDETSKILLLCDDELQQVCRRLEKRMKIDLKSVKSLKIHYESDTLEKLTQKIISIPAFKGLETPKIKAKDGFLPDFGSRYFTADFSYGLAILIEIGNLVGYPVPNMKKIMKWYKRVSKNDKQFRYKDYGIDSFDEFIKFYDNK